MTGLKNKAKAATASDADNALPIVKREGDTLAQASARAIVGPDSRHALTVANVNHKQFGNLPGAPGYGDYALAFAATGTQAAQGDLAFASKLLAAQAHTLDTIFTEMARRMALNMGEHLHATEIYARIALKAQANSRATIEALAKLHQPREQTVRHVHVNDGGQAVIADQFHHHQHGAQGGAGNGQSSEQPHAQGAPCPALSCPNPIGPAVPIACDQGQEPVQDARRER